MGPSPERGLPRGQSNAGDTAAEIGIALLCDLHPPCVPGRERVCVLGRQGGGMPDRLYLRAIACVCGVVRAYTDGRECWCATV